MKVSEIVVGERYRHISDFDGNTIFIGIGMRKLFTTNEYSEKHLVIIKDDNSDNLYKMVQEGENSTEDFWNGIVKEDSRSFIL